MKLRRRPNEPAPNELMTGLDAVGRITDKQFWADVRFWQGVRRVGGFFQLQLAEGMLRDVLETTDVVRQFVRLPPEIRQPGEAEIQTLVPSVLGGMALSQLLIRQYGGLIQEAAYDTGGEMAIDTYLDETGPIFRVHHLRQEAGEVLQDYAPARGGVAWYEDEVLLVRVSDRSMPTAALQASYIEVGDGQAFPVADYITLEPQLKASFVAPPAQ